MSPRRSLQGLSRRAYAEHRGVSHTAVAKAIRTDRIKLLPDGSIDPVAADAQWASRTDETKSSNSVSGNPRHRRQPGAPPSPATAGNGEGTEGAIDSGYTRARGTRESYTAGLVRLDYLKRVGVLVEADEVRKAAAECGARYNAFVASMPADLAPELLGIQTLEEMRARLERWANGVRAELYAPLTPPAEEQAS